MTEFVAVSHCPSIYVSVYNNAGQAVVEVRGSESEETLYSGSENSELRCSSTVDLGGLPDGIYFVKVTLASKRTIVKRIVKVER